MELICLQGRTLSGDDLTGLRALIARHPDWHRTALSRHLCELWNWRNGVGRLKDMAARTLLLKLQARGLIELPPPRTRTGRPCAQAPPVWQPELLPGTPTAIAGSLASLQPLSLELVQTPALRWRVGHLLAQYHYRGFNGAVGENLQYLARDVRGRELAVMAFGAAAWKVAVRDRFIGWSVAQRQQHLGALANQQRFLILPWVRVAHLASHLLARATRRLSADWQARYGHPVWLVETFVEQDRFAGTAYKAAGWRHLGPPLASPFSLTPDYPMNLLTYLLQATDRWAGVFPQQRSLQRAIALAFGILCGVGRRTLTRAITFQGNTLKDWSADYKVFSRSAWEPRALFDPILEQGIQEQSLQRIVLSTDDTRVWRNGKHVPQTQWHRDPLGPPFQTNLRWGHRFLQASLVLPLYLQDGESSSRSIPVRFEMAPVVKKPGRKASQADWTEYRRHKQEKNLSVQFVLLTQELRQHLNQTGHQAKRMFQVGDGSFCNRTVLREDWEAQNVAVVVRCRKDIVLCKRAPGKGRRFYGQTKFTPQQVRRRDSRARWQKARIFHGGGYRPVRFKELTKIYWQGGARKRPVRLLVVAPVGYRTSKNGRQYYRQPVYLLTTDLTTDPLVLLQAYFDRWGIEVNHRDEKEILGVGQAQVWNEKSVSKVPALLVAMYSWLLLAGLKCYGPRRTEVYALLPKWRRGAKRPSCLDLVTLLRKQLVDNPLTFATAKAPPTYQIMVAAAAA